MVNVIAIDGVIGAGKSALISQLKNDFICFEEPVKEWSLLQDFYNDMNGFAAPFQFQVLLSFHKLYSTFKSSKEKVIIERCPWTSKNIFTDLLVQKGHISQEEYQIYCRFYDKVVYPINMFIYLKVDTDVAYQRILKRNREGEQNITREYVEILNNRYEETFKTLNNVSVVDANQPQEDVTKKVVQLLKGV